MGPGMTREQMLDEAIRQVSTPAMRRSVLGHLESGKAARCGSCMMAMISIRQRFRRIADEQDA